MRLNRREFLQAATATAAGVMLGGVEGLAGEVEAAPSSASGTLTVWGFQGAIEGVQGQVAAFKRKYPKVDVSVKLFSYDDIHTNLLNAIVAGSGAPDLASIDVLRLWQYAHGLTPLNAQRSKYAHLFVPPTISLGTYKGNFYGLVTDSEPMGLLYRKDLWDKYGIKEGQIKTWSDLAAASNKVYNATKGKVHLYALNSNDTALFEVLAVEQGFGGNFFDYSDTKVIVDNPKLVQAAGVLKQLFNAKGVYPNPHGGYSGDEMTALLKKGLVASCIVAPGWFPQTLTQNMPEQAGKWRLMRAPAIKPGGRRAGYQYPTIFVIPKQSSQQKQAWSMELMGLSGAGARTLYLKDHVLPAYAPLLNELKPKGDRYFGGQKVYQLWSSIAHDCPRIVFGRGFTQAQDILGSHLDAILKGKTSPQRGMRDAAAEMRSKLKTG